MSDFKYGDPVKINRPGRKEHGRLARYLRPGALEGYAEVAINPDGPARLPAMYNLDNSSRSPRKSFPLSQIEKHES